MRHITRLAALLAALTCFASTSALAKEIGIAFIEDSQTESAPRLSTLIIKELQPLLRAGDKLTPFVLSPSGAPGSVRDSLAQTTANRNVDFVVVTGFLGSQDIYKEAKFPKPTYLLRVLDPALTGAPLRSKVRNLRSYSTTNEVVGMFERLRDLFQAKRVGIILPTGFEGAQRSIASAVQAGAKKAGIRARFLALDFQRDIQSQLTALDAVILPPVSRSTQERSALIQALQQKKLPSYAVGGDQLVLSGALISDTLDEDERVLARRVALDLQLAISGETRTRGMRRLEAKKRTTINIDTARAIGVDFTLDELMTARVVQGRNSVLKLGFLSTLELARERNLDLRGQNQQLAIDTESLAQARARRAPQLSAQLEHKRQGGPVTTQNSVGSLSLSQSIYSPSTNESIDVAKLGMNASEQSLEQKQLDTVQDTASAYFQALQTQAQFETNIRALTLNRENLVLAQQRKRSGSGTGAEIYRWQAIIASSETAVLRAYTANTSAQRQLARLLNTRLEIPTTLTDVDLDQPPFDLLHEAISPFLKSTRRAEMLRETSAARALAQSPQLKSVAANIAINEVRLKTLKRSYYTPELAVTARANRYPNGAESAAGTPLGYEQDWAVALTATLPLWQGGARRSQARQYAAQKSLAQTQLQTAQLALWASSGDAVNNLVANYRAIGLSDQAEQAALKSQQISQRAYKLGAASVTELLDTQNEYREAQDNANIARYQYLTALVNFQALMGELPMLRSGAEQQKWIRLFKQSMNEKAR